MVIDRFEGNYAVCQTKKGEILHIKKTDLPLNASEGDFIIQRADGTFFAEKKAASIRVCKNRSRLAALFSRSISNCRANHTSKAYKAEHEDNGTNQD